jgi:hypothetical protein
MFWTIKVVLSKTKKMQRNDYNLVFYSNDYIDEIHNFKYFNIIILKGEKYQSFVRDVDNHIEFEIRNEPFNIIRKMYNHMQEFMNEEFRNDDGLFQLTEIYDCDVYITLSDKERTDSIAVHSLKYEMLELLDIIKGNKKSN